MRTAGVALGSLVFLEADRTAGNDLRTVRLASASYYLPCAVVLEKLLRRGLSGLRHHDWTRETF
jgi:hypothetical protein